MDDGSAALGMLVELETARHDAIAAYVRARDAALAGAAASGTWLAAVRAVKPARAAVAAATSRLMRHVTTHAHELLVPADVATYCVIDAAAWVVVGTYASWGVATLAARMGSDVGGDVCGDVGGDVGGSNQSAHHVVPCASMPAFFAADCDDMSRAAFLCHATRATVECFA